jgi:predicted nucleic acid-binding protein
MRPVLLDSSIYISALRVGDAAVFTLRRLVPDAPVWLNAVVLEELYAGVSGQDRRVIERLERDFDRARRILVPNLNDWTQTGRVLARLGRAFGYEQIGRPA